MPQEPYASLVVRIDVWPESVVWRVEEGSRPAGGDTQWDSLGTGTEVWRDSYVACAQIHTLLVTALARYAGHFRRLRRPRPDTSHP